MNITIVTCFNRRPAVSRILINTWIRLKHELPEHDINLVAGVTDDEDADLCDQYGLQYVRHDNIPGAKWNAAFTLAMSNDPDAYLIMGDDDSISTDGFRLLVYAINLGGNYAGFKSNYFYDLRAHKAMYHVQPFVANKLIGCGRMLSRFAVHTITRRAIISWRKQYMGHQVGDEINISLRSAEYLQGYQYAKIKSHVDGVIFTPHLKQGLDHDSEMRMVMSGITPVNCDHGKIHVTDFKSKVTSNIWPYPTLQPKCKECSPNDATWYLSEGEREYISTLLFS